MNVPGSTVGSIIVKLKKFGITRTLPRAVHHFKTELTGKKGIGQGGDQEPNGQSNRASEVLSRDGRPISEILHQSGLYGRVVWYMVESGLYGRLNRSQIVRLRTFVPCD